MSTPTPLQRLPATATNRAALSWCWRARTEPQTQNQRNQVHDRPPAGRRGGLEAGITVMALLNQKLPPTINLDNVDPECRLDYVPNKAVDHSFDVALSNSFGFGGINATLIIRRWTE